MYLTFFKEERKQFSLLQPSLQKSQRLLRLLELYSGCEEFIRTALNQPDKDHEAEAFEEVKKAVHKLKKLYKFAIKIEPGYTNLLLAICNGSTIQNIQTSQTLMCQLGQLFYYSFQFDQMKMLRPFIQNDLAYYKRFISRPSTNQAHMQIVNLELASTMSFFYGYATPMMKVLTDVALKMREHHQALLEGLSTITIVSYNMIKRDGSLPEDDITQLLCLMTGSIIIYDNLCPFGAFHKKTLIRPIKGCIALLKEYENASYLMNSLRFSSKTLDSETTPADIKRVFNY